MNINVTLFGQMITFALFVWFTLRFVWPPMIAAIEERRQKITEGLAAGEQGQRVLFEAQKRVEELVRESHQKSSEILHRAQTQAEAVLVQAKERATLEVAAIQQRAEVEIQAMTATARQELKKEISQLVMSVATAVIQREIRSEDHAALIQKALQEIS